MDERTLPGILSSNVSMASMEPDKILLRTSRSSVERGCECLLPNRLSAGVDVLRTQIPYYFGYAIVVVGVVSLSNVLARTQHAFLTLNVTRLTKQFFEVVARSFRNARVCCSQPST